MAVFAFAAGLVQEQGPISLCQRKAASVWMRTSTAETRRASMIERPLAQARRFSDRVANAVGGYSTMNCAGHVATFAQLYRRHLVRATGHSIAAGPDD